MRLAAVAWAVSLGLACTIGGALAAAGIVLSLLYTGSAMATTAIGTLIPVLSDSGELRTRSLVVRGAPALSLYRHVLDQRDRLALAFFQSTQLPLVLAITTLAHENGEMTSSTAAALVGAADLSMLIFPLIGLRLRSHNPNRVRGSELAASNVVP